MEIQDASSGSPPPAPIAVERVDFRDEFARRRRSAWFWSAFCLLIAGGLGVVLSTVITPLLLLAVGGMLHLVARVGLFPDIARAAAHDIGLWAVARDRDFEALLAALDRVNGLADIGRLLPPLAALSTVAVPALLASALVWLALRRVSLRGEDGAMVAHLRARAPDAADPEERQLANIVAEIAIAAGVPPPRLLLVDAPEINAAAIGSGSEHASLLVTSGLLVRLGRAETAAVVAHLVASVGQGDMRLTHGILAVFQTFGFFVTFLDLPFRLSAWRSLGGLLLIMLGLRRRPDDIVATLESVEGSLDAEAMPDIERVWGFIPISWLRLALLTPLLPFMLISMLLRIVLFLWSALLLGPPLALIWRTRRYAADTLAVRFNRDPDALARALAEIGQSGVPDGGVGREYCFIQGAANPTRGFAARRTITVSLHPPLGRRLQRLAAMGAAGRWGGGRPWHGWAMLKARPWAALLVGFLLALLVPLGLVLAACVAFLTALVMTLGLAAGLTIVIAVLT